jgi:hypothetical protein
MWGLVMWICIHHATSFLYLLDNFPNMYNRDFDNLVHFHEKYMSPCWSWLLPLIVDESYACDFYHKDRACNVVCMEFLMDQGYTPSILGWR